MEEIIIIDYSEFQIEQQPGGGYNFGLLNKKSNMLDELPINKSFQIRAVPTYQVIYKEDTGYGVYECEPEDKDDGEFKIAGTFLKPLTIGQTYEIHGKIVVYKGEKQINVDVIKNVKPVTEKSVISYLKTLKGLDMRAEMIYEMFGLESLDVLIADPIKIAKEIKGIGKKSVISWQEELNKLRDDQQTMAILLSYGLSLKQAKGLFENYKEGVIYKIEQNPYFLAQEVRGYGFEKCDKIAKQLGYDLRGMYRIQEGIMHVLNRASFEGHCYLPTEELIKETKNLLDYYLPVIEMKQLLNEHHGEMEFNYKLGEFNYKIKYDELKKAYDNYYNETNTYTRENKRYKVININSNEINNEFTNLAQVNKLILEDDKIYLPSLYEAEHKVAERIKALAQTHNEKFAHVLKDLESICSQRNLVLEEKQKEAVLEFAKGEGGFWVLNGSAGCGKTYVLNIILEILEMQYARERKRCSIKVFAPTGKAAKVASKTTNRECITVHRGLKYNPTQGFEFNENNPLDADVIVIDESSMLDIMLSKYLLSAIMDGTKVIFSGDTKQLPSVGAGNVLFDLIESKMVKVVTLNVVKRQGKESGIIRNANNIIEGKMISSCKDTKDAYIFKKETPIDAQQAIIKSIKEIRAGMFDSLEDIQVLCPQKTSLIGTDIMNYLIQKELNPGNDGLKIFNKRIKITNSETKEEEYVRLYFRKGDKVIHIKNNYSMPWYIKNKTLGYQEIYDTIGIANGECGIIEDIIKEEYFDSYKTKIIVKYDDKYVFYDDTFDELEHAYALTIHKSQGSQWKAVIIPIMRLNYGMLDNNLFYTAYTRAQLFCVVIGQPEAIQHAIKTHKTRKRFTGLQEILKT